MTSDELKAMLEIIEQGWDMAESESRAANLEWGQPNKVQEAIIAGRQAYATLLQYIGSKPDAVGGEDGT